MPSKNKNLPFSAESDLSPHSSEFSPQDQQNLPDIANSQAEKANFHRQKAEECYRIAG